MDAKEIFLRVGSAVLFGALVGLERERKHRPAGFRTMILVSLGSAAFMIIAHELVVAPSGVAVAQNSAAGPGAGPIGTSDMSRVLQGLIGGIGFLGAGAVIQNKRAVRGLTTAAAVWVTAAIGAACGLGLYVVAGIVAIATLFTLVILGFVERRYLPETVEGDDAAQTKKRAEVGEEQRSRASAGHTCCCLCLPHLNPAPRFNPSHPKEPHVNIAAPSLSTAILLAAALIVLSACSTPEPKPTTDPNTIIRTPETGATTGRSTFGVPIILTSGRTALVPFAIESDKGWQNPKDEFQPIGAGQNSLGISGVPGVPTRISGSIAGGFSPSFYTTVRWHNAIVRDLSTKDEWPLITNRGVISRWQQFTFETPTAPIVDSRPRTYTVTLSDTNNNGILDAGDTSAISVTEAEPPRPISPSDRITLMAFTVTLNDTNKNGMLDSEDASAILLTDGDGRNPRFITPPNARVTNLQAESAAGLIFISLITDTNADNLFDFADEPIAYVFNARAGSEAVAQPAVSAGMKARVESLLK